ncbi:MAG: alpha-amylase family glycosyl hydrolase [Bacteroidota bacterium]|nr:alpha-amylase family glycosyl hydrolase [Bacteroidota bacterium]
MKKVLVLLSMIIAFTTISCDNAKTEKENSAAAVQKEYIKGATIYEVNIRQFTEEGTINAFVKHLPRLKELGVDILWLMPIQPIGELNRKGSMGSYYSVKDYFAVNPEFGTKKDFQTLVDKAHEMGFKVILDWVANHSAWDNANVKLHPEWYTADSAGNLVSPFDWTDVVDFNYDNNDMRAHMIQALKYWVNEFDIDGYRCDVAGMVPVDFWNNAVNELNKIKPVFMLAEDEGNIELLKEAFDMHYGWELHHIMNEIAKGEQSVKELKAYFAKCDTLYEDDDIKMNFITNHDENSWNGTVNERMGNAAEAFAVMAFTVPGMPLIYSGQEDGLDKRLKFFEKDIIEWEENSTTAFYKNLTKLKESNIALGTPKFGGSFEIIETQNESVFAYKRVKDDNEVVVIINLSDKEQKYSLATISGEYTIYPSNNKEQMKDAEYTLPAWKYRVLIK